MRFKRAGFLTKIIVLGLLIYMGTSLLDLRGQIQTAQEELDALDAKTVQMQMENQQLADAITNSDDPDVLEQAMRDRGYIMQDETVYKDVAR